MAVDARIADIEAEMARTQKNKATARHLGLLKARLAKLKAELLAPAGGKSGGPAVAGFDVTKYGDVRLGLLGFPSVGKSTLLTKMTGTYSEAASYEFTTLTAIPGVIRYKGAKLQLVDLPGIIEGARDGKGRGRQVIGTAKSCDIILLVVDATKPMGIKALIEQELEGFGIRLNKKPPELTVTRQKGGGVAVRSSFPQKYLDLEMVRSILSEYRILNADVNIKYQDATVDELIDVVEGSRVYIPCLYVLNKVDQISVEELDIITDIGKHFVPVSAYLGWNMDELLARIWEYCGLIRIYTKPKGQLPDFEEPVILKTRGAMPTVEDFCNKIHRGIMHQFKYAWVWGASVRHQPQKVGKEHVLADEDVVQIVKK